MQNLLVLIFPQFIDGLNSVLGVQHPKVKFWVSLVTSLIGGFLLNLQTFQQILTKPDFYNVSWELTLLILIATATQGIYLKYWENHSLRSTLFPSVTNTVTTTTATPAVESPIAQ